MNLNACLKKMIFTFGSFLLLQPVFAQTQLSPGVLYPLNGDSITGFIDQRSLEKNTYSLLFKKTATDPWVKYTPKDLSGFKVGAKTFESAVVKTDISSYETNKLKTFPESKLASDTTFLQALMKGKKALYVYTNQAGKDQFYTKDNAGFELLIYSRYLKQENGKSVLAENNKYKGQLALYLGGCSTISAHIAKLSYSRESFERLFNAYAGCTNTAVTMAPQKERTSVELGVIAGISRTDLSFKSDAFPYLVNAGYSPSTNLTAGLSFDIVLPTNQRRLSLYNEVGIMSYKASGSYKDAVHENYYSVHTTTFEYTYLKLNNMARYKIPAGSISAFLNAGITNGFAIAEKNVRIKESVFNGSETKEEGQALEGSRKHEQGYMVGAGAQFRKYSCEVRYEKGNGMANNNSLDSSTQKLSLLVGFRIL